MNNDQMLRQALISILTQWENELSQKKENVVQNTNELSNPRVEASTDDVPRKIAFSVKDLSSYLGVSQDSIYAMVRDEQIPYVRIRRRILFHKDSIDVWLQSKQFNLLK
ncbi:helix-turn-helix domain-containing protein [Paenibacillus sp. WC2504]|uniref:helix-turn-helix domain-containing protein n=1 Tax=Paenibacillus sp. WC2504 TaxID=3461403 RepID=UPI0040460EAC